jgi:predicted enzyme related to lactoylglutathione lyase
MFSLKLTHSDCAAAKFYTNTFEWKFQIPSAGIPATKMQTFTAPGDIFPDEGVISKVDEISGSGAARFYINVDNLQAAMDVG